MTFVGESMVDGRSSFYDVEGWWMMLDMPDEIRAIVGSVTEVFTPVQGDTSTVKVVRGDRGQCVVKHSVGPQYSAWVEREYQVLETLRPLELPVPQPYGFHKHVTARGPEAWLVMQWIPGRTVRTVLAREHNRAVRAQIVLSWARSLATLHATPPPSKIGPEGSWLDERLEQAARNLQHFTVDGDATLLRRLQRERPTPEPQTLIHGDFTMDNTLVEGGEVMGIIDWSGGAVGDPRCDLILATQLKRGIFGKRDYDLFWDSYGRAPLSKDERAYFEDLYEFF